MFIIYFLFIIFLFLIYILFFAEKNYLHIGNNHKYRMYSDRFEVNVDGQNYKFEKKGNRWEISSSYGEKNVGIQEKFELANTIAWIDADSGLTKYRKVILGIFPFVVILPIAIGIISNIIDMIPVDEYGKKDIVAFITDETITNEDADNKEYIAKDEKGIINGKLFSVKTNHVQLTECASAESVIAVLKETNWYDENNNEIPANKLIGERLCLSYEGKHGELCYFIGQYNDDYQWDGECTICAYSNGFLYYVTDDVYENGRLISYKRFSKHNSDWIYTEKTVDENGSTFGDTWSYDYKLFTEKNHNTKLPISDDLYLVSEVRSMLIDSLKSHYRGAYDANQSWYDVSGDAYVVKYKSGKVEEVYKGTVLNSNYGEGECIRLQDDNTFLVMKGIFHDVSGQEINNISRKNVLKNSIGEEIANQKFESEIDFAGWNWH